MDNHNADGYSDAADVLKVLHDTVEMYVSSMQDSEDKERGCSMASASASSSSLTTSAAIDLAITRQHIQENVPRLLGVCASVRSMLRRVAMLPRQPSRRSDSESLSASSSLGSSTTAAKRHEAVSGLIMRKLGDVMENAHMIRGLAKVQQQQQHLLPSHLSRVSSLASPDDNDGPLLMKQLIRVTLYNLEDMERLLRAAYPNELFTDTVNWGGDEVDEADRPTLFPHSPRVRRTLTRSHGQRLGYNGGSSGHEGRRDSTGCAHSTSSGDGGGVNSSLETPRSSTHTAPYVRRSPSFDQANLLTGSWATANQEDHDGDSEAAPTVRLTDTTPTSPTGAYPSASILARSQQADPLSSASSFVASAPGPSSPRVQFVIGEPPDSEGQDSSLAECALASTAMPKQSSPCDSNLLSNPVVRLSSTDNDKHSRNVSDRAPADSVTASTLSTATTGGSLGSSALQLGDDAPPRSRDGNSSVGSRGGIARALPPPVGLPPRSPRRYDPQQLATSLASSSGDQRLPLAPDPAWVDPNMRVRTYHMQRLPGELWGVIIEDHQAKMEAAFRADVVDLFKYGEVSPALRGEDVREVYFTVVGTDLHIRIELEHLCSMAEPEINTRLNLCSYPHMTELYEEFFKAHQAKELDAVEDSTATPDSDTPRYSETYSNDGDGTGGDEEDEGASDGSDEQRSLSLASDLNAAEAAADDSAAGVRTPPLLIATDSRTMSVVGSSAATPCVFSTPNLRAAVGEDSGGLGETGREASASVSPCALVSVESHTHLQEGATSASASRHPHTVRIPGARWARLLLSPAPEKSDLKYAFVKDTGVALGVLPSEAREACQEVRFSFGSLVVDFMWDNAELYPGAVPLSAPEIDTALKNCLYPSVRAFYTDACAALHLDDDLAVVPAAKRASSSGGGSTAESVVAQLILPDKSELDLASGTHSALALDMSGNAEKGEAASVPKSSREDDWSTARLPMAPQLAQAERSPSTFPSTATTVLYAADSAAAASRKVASSQQQRGAPLPPFNRTDSIMSNASVEAEPRIAVPQPTVGSHIRSSRGQKQRRVHSPAGTPRVGAPATANANAADSQSSKAAARRAMPKSSQEPATLNQFALLHGVSVQVLCQWNPALAELDADAVIPATVTVYVPRLSLSPGRARGQAGPGVTSEARRHRDPNDGALADMTNDTPHSRTARLPTPVARPNAKATAAAAASRAVSMPASPSHAVASPKLPAQASEPEKAKISTIITISKKDSTPAVVTSRWPPPLSVEDVEKCRSFLTPPTVPSATVSAAAPAAELAPPVLPFPMTTSHSASKVLETPVAAGAKVPRGAVSAAVAPAQPGAASTKPTAPFSSAKPTPTARSTREVLPQALQPDENTATVAPAGGRVPPARTVYQLFKPQTTRVAEPREIEAVLAAHSVPRLHLDGVAFKAAAAADDGARGRAVGEDHVDHENHKEAVEGSTMLLEWDLGLRLDNLTVVQVRRSSVAARANVQPGDTLRTMNGQALLCRSDFEHAMAQQLQQHRKGSEERTLFVTAMTSRGIPTTYRLRIPTLRRDGATAQPDLPLQHDLHHTSALAAQQQAQPPPRRLGPLSARMSSAARGTPQQQRGLQPATERSARVPVERAGPASARTPVSSLGAAARVSRVVPINTNAVLLCTMQPLDMVGTSSIDAGRAESLSGSAWRTDCDGSASSRTRAYVS
ncbi:conserved hypothetical protein [Leishmania major strain Friedlin]|uniref:Flagellar attachment zone protein 1 conserved domain-containing protein n=1 Tax=Leishmania major TaxID=5664 RepID=Q4QDW5_LEIMA|nr:conserved hypothetical protein [Leishmania major strain Friedlin]CAG9572462.1 hypothetical_protein_-_conserved [Leishmania major strain Friedlin]CAJ03735.1 conserved hypothetical protein [Leishmania major strain Friedlin]|eukprot:XP_001682483.1 conserved hypothetical protein [Leishmania major strain Friedlin]